MALPFPAIDPVAIQIGPFAVRWYGLAYFAGILLGWRYGRRLAANERLWGGRPAPVTPADIDDLLLWLTLGIVLGGRLGYALFYEPGHFLADPLAIARVWEGGMSFHGGLLGTILALSLFARRRGLPLLSLLDIAAASTPFGLFFGRLANFINGELFGRPSDVPWAMVFPYGGPEPRHPSQLYEAALEGILLFLVLAFLFWRTRARWQPGRLVGAFLLVYGLSRFVVEFVREPDAHLVEFAQATQLHMGQWLSLPMILAGLYLILTAAKRAERVRPVPADDAG
jgi:phosphatidylglycerol:prolipoprotein diacylglycerol transferase